MTRVEVEPGIHVFVQEWGPQTGKPLVLIHGFPFSHRIFDYQALHLAQAGHRIVGIDLRGFGQSDKPWQGNDYDTWGRDVRRVVETLALRDYTLAGFSMGGAIAAHYSATQNDSHLTKLALLAAAAPIAAPGESDKQMLNIFIQAAQADQAAFVHGFVQNAFQTPPSVELARFLDDIGTDGALHAEVRGLEELRDRNLVEDMGRIKVPVLICHGVPDKVVPLQAGEAQAQMIAGAELIRFEKSGHCLMYEEKEKLADELARFHTA